MSEESPIATSPTLEEPSKPVIPETYLQRWSTRSKLTAEKVEAICLYVEGGVAQSIAARAHGVADRTWRSWFAKGRDVCAKLEAGQDITREEEIYADLYERVQDAKAKSEAYLVDLVMKAAPLSWQAAMTKLERSHPERFGRRERLEHTGVDGKPIQTQSVPLADITGLARVIGENTDAADDIGD